MRVRLQVAFPMFLKNHFLFGSVKFLVWNYHEPGGPPDLRDPYSAWLFLLPGWKQSSDLRCLHHVLPQPAETPRRAIDLALDRAGSPLPQTHHGPL